MFLSNPRKILFVLIFFAGLSTGCWWSQNEPQKQVSLTGEPVGEFPFSTIEPAIYSAHVYTRAAGVEKHWFVARKNEKWRFDIYRGETLAVSQIFSGKLYQLDHTQKTATEMPSPTDPFTAFPFSDTAGDMLRGHEHYEFEEAGREGAIIKYKARSDISKGDIVISFDTAMNMIVRQDFIEPNGETNFTYELKELNKEVSDEVFEIPPRYQKRS